MSKKVHGVIWERDRDWKNCSACQMAFSLLLRRHHCRKCGSIFCGTCSAYNVSLPQMNYKKRVRVCVLCWNAQISSMISKGRQRSNSEENKDDQIDTNNLSNLDSIGSQSSTDSEFLNDGKEEVSS